MVQTAHGTTETAADAAPTGQTVSVLASELRTGDYVVINGIACRVMEISQCKSGKHGHTKLVIRAVDADGRVHDLMIASSHSVEVPVVRTATYALVDIERDGRVVLLDATNAIRDDLTLPRDPALAAQIREAFAKGGEVTLIVTTTLGDERVTAFETP